MKNPSTPSTTPGQHDVVARLRTQISKHAKTDKEQAREHENQFRKLDSHRRK